MRDAITAAGAVALVVCALLAPAPELAAQQPDSGWRAAVEEDVAYLSSLKPPAQGSSAELHAADYVQRRLTAMGLAPQLSYLGGSGSGQPLSAIVEAVVPGTREDVLVMAVPLASPAPAPGDPIGAWRRRVEPTASGVAPALALGFARSLAGSTQPPPITVRFLFLGAEHRAGEPDTAAGSRVFLQEFQAGVPVAVLYLDLRAIPSHLVPYAGGAGIESPPWLFRRVVTALRRAGQPLRLAGANTVHLVRLGLAQQSRLAPFHRAGHPALYLAGRYRPVDDSQRDLWLNRMQGFFGLLLASFAGGVPADWDRHYLLFHQPGWTQIIAEYEYVIALLVLLAMAVTYCFAVAGRLRYFLAPLWRDLWRVPLLAAAAYAAIGAGSAAAGLLSELRGVPALWHEAPVLFAALKVAAALLVAAALRYLRSARWLPPPRPAVARFDWAAAVVLLAALIGAAAAVNVALTFPLVWALLCAFLATTSRNRWVRFICILPAPFWIVAAAGGLLALPALPFVESVLFASPAGDLLTAAVALPFILLWRGGTAGLRAQDRRRPLSRRRTALHAWTAALAVLLCAGSLYALTMNPYGAGASQPLAARAVVDLDTGRSNLHLSSPGPIGAVAIDIAGEERSVTTRQRQFTVPAPTLTGLMTVTESAETYRDRHTVALGLAPAGQPRELRLTLESDDEFTLLGASHRFHKLDQGSYRLLIGPAPPNPLALNLTVPRNLKLVLRYELEYDRAPVPVTVAAGDMTVLTSTQVRGSIPISS